MAAALLWLLGLAIQLPTADPGRVLHAAVGARGPGAMVAVARHGVELWRGQAGLADVEAARPFAPGTLFDLASCSKQLTAATVLALVERGQLALDDDARTVLPELPARSAGRAIHIADLLHMTAGLADYEDELDDLSAASSVDALRAVVAAGPAFRPGARYAYSNTAYMLLALLTERATGEDFGALMRRLVFAPAGMPTATVLTRPGQLIPNRAQGYVRNRRGWRRTRDDTPRIYGDGNVFASIDDVLAWDRALWAGRVLRPESRRLLVTPGRTDGGSATDYGMGFELAVDGRRHTIASHSGSWDGTATYLRRDLTDGLTVVVLSNDESLDVTELGDDLAALWPGLATR